MMIINNKNKKSKKTINKVINQLLFITFMLKNLLTIFVLIKFFYIAQTKLRKV